jgi:ubiquinone/menaquinone biosynthesis C-methylase UbiE
MRHIPCLPEDIRDLVPLFSDKADYNEFTYARRSHIKLLEGKYITASEGVLDIDFCDLKAFQDGMITAFIDQMLVPGGKVLEVGGGNSRVLPLFAKRHECWNIDKFEGCGNGPLALPDAGYRIVRDYMGNVNRELPEKYFDLVFSISALEHVPDHPDLFPRILADINRVLKPGGYSAHFLDIVFKHDGTCWMNAFTPWLFRHAWPLNAFVPPEAFLWKEDMYIMSGKSYNAFWRHITKKSRVEFGIPSSIAVFWRKARSRSENV